MAKKKKQQIHILSLALALGSLCAAVMFAFGVIGIISGWWPQSFDLVAEWYRGFGPTALGVILGTVYGFVDGFIGGVLIAWLYNEFFDMFGR